MSNLGPGRPRLEQRSRRAETPRAEILDAAGELFTTKGYANTSTRAVADAVGIRQASLYHHFSSKDDILDALLAETIAGPVEFAQRLADETVAAAVRLYALALFDLGQLRTARWNLGALYLLPELRTERFEAFRRRRDELREHYERLAGESLSAASLSDEARVLPFRMVETMIGIRSDAGTAPADLDQVIADGIARVVGEAGDLTALRAEATALLARLT
ncbi:TetR/AcrR family transcriptional regulator [Nocardia camponoti]|uniref:TetR family transcriptional regulator n=1 Tax=Nocardia camponoti TaxID=1616106 RepID=A0A917QGQ6_9NOCA|nr:TetR/AcrR family transcriptional regulator [Nocardia camponoti]GGK49624.1 TetR family transcriptional regulator [Nocardia camponoti]